MGHDDQVDDGLAEVKAILGRLQRISRPGNDNAAAPLPLEVHPDPLAALIADRRRAWLRWRVRVVVSVASLAIIAVVAAMVFKIDRDGDLFAPAGGRDTRSAAVQGQDRLPAATAAPAAAAPQPLPAPATAAPDTVRSERPQPDAPKADAPKPDAPKPDAPTPAPPGSSGTGGLEAGKLDTGEPVTLADRTLLPSSPARFGSDLLASGQVQAARAALLGAVAADPVAADSADVAFALARSYDPRYLATLRSADAAPDVAEAKRWYQAWYDIAVRQGLVSDRVPLGRIIRSMD